MSKIPFDVGGFRTIEFDITDPDSLQSAVEKLRKYASQARQGNWGDTPIKLANIMRVTKEDSPEILLMKQAVEGISNFSTRLTRLEDFIQYPRSVSTWAMQGSVALQDDPEVSNVLIKMARDHDSRQAILLLGQIMDTPGLSARLSEAQQTKVDLSTVKRGRSTVKRGRAIKAHK